jgi:selenoprotein W-related protein
LAAQLKEQFSANSELLASGGGVFEITVDDKLVFSKKSLGRFPDDGEIVGLIRGSG